LLPLSDKEPLKAGLDSYTSTLEREYRALMRAKFGLTRETGEDDELIRDFLGLLQGSHADYTIMFRHLSTFSSQPGAKNEHLREFFLDRDRFDGWALRYRERLHTERSHDDERRRAMDSVNPKYVLRNYLAQNAIEKAQQKDFSEIDRLFALLQRPCAEQSGMDAYAAPPPNWGKHLSVSCSS
jgi:uncharacterized protein YdiU (UPF0061 family)